MRVVATGMSLLLLVTFSILYRMTDDPKTVESSMPVIAAPSPTTQTMPIYTPTPTRNLVAQQVHPTATPIRSVTPPQTPASLPEPTPTPFPIADAEVPVETEIVEEPEVASEIDVTDEAPATEDVSEPTALLASADVPAISEVTPEAETETEDGLISGWSDAIQTPDGSVLGVVTSGMVNVRSAPSVDAETVGEVYARWPVMIYGEEIGDFVAGTELWYQIGAGQYISAAFVEPFIAPIPDTTYDGYWVDVDLSENYAVAYDGDTPVYAAIVLTGKPGHETPTGAFTIFKRIENEVLDSATVGIPEGDPDYYYIPDVRYTQYFADHGIALHTNYWSEPWEWGSSTSHGCVNLMEADAAWFWSFLSAGSVVNVHY